MNRETKIGLLVGLVFIIVVGILLSDHFRSTTDLPQAALDHAGPSVRQALSAPGANLPAPPITMAPAEVTPRAKVATPRDLEPPTSPVMAATDGQRADSQRNTQPAAPLTGIDPALANAARQQGESLIPPDGVGTPAQKTDSRTLVDATPTTLHSYKAAPGDTVSKLAARYLGANTRANRDLIIKANPSLKDNPNKIIVGQSYVIPSKEPTDASANSSALAPSDPLTSTNAAIKPPVAAAAPGQWIYTVKANDSLWAIANSQLGDPGAIDAIKELNRDVLRGGNTVRPGMKLALPAKPVASLN